MSLNESTISVFVREMRVAVRIGLLESEKRAPQALDVSVDLFAEPDYLLRGAGGDILNYALLHDFILGWEKREHTELLETLAQDLLDFGFAFNEVMAVKLSLSKPDIFDQAQQAGLSLYMRRVDYSSI